MSRATSQKECGLRASNAETAIISKAHDGKHRRSIVDTRWMEQGLCRQIGGDLWHADEGHGSTAATNQAKLVCNGTSTGQYDPLSGCPVRNTCLEFAYTTRQECGVWGGVTASERRKEKRRRRRVA